VQSGGSCDTREIPRPAGKNAGLRDDIFRGMRRAGCGILSSFILFGLAAVTIAGAQTASNSAAAVAFTGPRLTFENGAGQLIVKGQPFLILGGELGNSSAGTAAQADVIVPKLAAMHVNTILMPVAWEQIEPKEGAFDFSILDHWIVVSREHNMHLVLLWFGSWKNAFSNYAPAWVKDDAKRFPRTESIDEQPLEILSTFSAENRRCDARAFAALMRHLRQEDSEQQTVLMVQVENEVGYLGPGRDRSAEANRVFHAAVPDTLIHALVEKRLQLSPELSARFISAHTDEHGKNWSEVFGDAADEVFMAWSYASYVDAVASAGKREYALPMYVNAQLPAPFERAGEYPSGGPHPYFLEVWRAAAPSIDFYSPDIYWPNFEYWIQRYEVPGNPIFVPEARLESAPYNALYAYGQGRAFGFSPFAIDSLAVPEKDDDKKPAMMQVYELLDGLRDLLPAAQMAGLTRGLVLHASSPRPTQTVVLGGYLFEATLSRSWPARTVIADDGAMLIMQASPGEFYVIGSGLTVSFARDPDVDAGIAGIESVEQVSRVSGRWITERRLNGDQTNQGRQLLMDPQQPHIYRVRLYSLTRRSAQK
jgi:beta-galactosidase GanA